MEHHENDDCQPPYMENDLLASGWAEHEEAIANYEEVVNKVVVTGELPNYDPREFSCGQSVPISQTDGESESLEIAGFCPACGEKGGHEVRIVY